MNSFNTTTDVGCQFTLFPMSDQFVDVILSALGEVDTSNVSMKTDDISTFIRGKAVHLFDVTQAIFLHAATSGYHVAMSGTFSIGCPGKEIKNVVTYEEEVPLNKAKEQHVSQQAGCKVAIYPMGSGNYIKAIEKQIDLAKQQNVRVRSSHYATRLDGEVKDVFHTMQALFMGMQKEVSRLSMTFTISANSPSTKEGDMNE